MRPDDGELAETALKRCKQPLEPEEVASLLAKLPPESKKILALYYHEHMRLLDIATCLGFTESDVRRIHDQSLESLHLNGVQSESRRRL
jgi:DNA-directed RNA polymerase specialized sigma subunit